MIKHVAGATVHPHPVQRDRRRVDGTRQMHHSGAQPRQTPRRDARVRRPNPAPLRVVVELKPIAVGNPRGDRSCRRSRGRRARPGARSVRSAGRDRKRTRECGAAHRHRSHRRWSPAVSELTAPATDDCTELSGTTCSSALPTDWSSCVAVVPTGPGICFVTAVPRLTTVPIRDEPAPPPPVPRRRYRCRLRSPCQRWLRRPRRRLWPGLFPSSRRCARRHHRCVQRRAQARHPRPRRRRRDAGAAGRRGSCRQDGQRLGRQRHRAPLPRRRPPARTPGATDRRTPDRAIRARRTHLTPQAPPARRRSPTPPAATHR